MHIHKIYGKVLQGDRDFSIKRLYVQKKTGGVSYYPKYIYYHGCIGFIVEEKEKERGRKIKGKTIASRVYGTIRYPGRLNSHLPA